MERGLIVAFLSVVLLSAACAKKKVVPAADGGKRNDGEITTVPTKNPPSVETKPTDGGLTDSTKRSLIANVQIRTSFESGLQDLGIHTPDVCFQYVTLESKAVKKTFLELSSVPCPGGDALIDDKDVKLRLGVENHPTYFTQYLVREESRDLTLGIFRKLQLDGVSGYYMEGLCELDANDWNREYHFSNNCLINVEGSLFGDPALYVD